MADPEAKILEKVASRNCNTVTTYSNQSQNKKDLSNVVNEKNQRTSQGRIQSFADKLKDIPWN